MSLPKDLLNEINNLDYVKLFIEHFNRVAILDGSFCRNKKKYNHIEGLGSTDFRSVFGNMCISNIKILTYEIVSKWLKQNQIWKYNHEKYGIEILGMKPNRTADGKYKYENVSITELKKSCKINGLKSYTKCDKTDLVKLLMKL
tara:strand:- start:40 stop:471 length:432 start_codon:yes stop_codon:yes gene_type:complete